MSLVEKRCGNPNVHAEHIWRDTHGRCLCDGESAYTDAFVDGGDRQDIQFERGAYDAETDLAQSWSEHHHRDWLENA